MDDSGAIPYALDARPFLQKRAASVLMSHITLHCKKIKFFHSRVVPLFLVLKEEI